MKKQVTRIALSALALSLMVGSPLAGFAEDTMKKDDPMKTQEKMAPHEKMPTHEKMSAKRMEHKEKMMDDFFKEVNATPDQKKKIEALDSQYHAQIEPLEKQMWEKKKALMSYVSEPNSDKTQAIQKESEIVDLKSQIGKLYIDQAYTQKSYLTPEQQQKAAAFYEKQADKWEGKEEKEEKKEED